MDTVQVSAVKAAIQFCEDGNTIRKLNLRRAQKEIGIAEPDFQDTIRQILCLIRDCLKHKLTNDYYSEPRTVSFDAWSKNPDNRYDVCMQNIINGLDDVCELWLNGYSYPRICADIDYFDELYPSTYFQDIDLTSEQLDRLCQALIEKKYIASSTRSEDFRWLFQGVLNYDTIIQVEMTSFSKSARSCSALIRKLFKPSLDKRNRDYVYYYTLKKKINRLSKITQFNYKSCSLYVLYFLTISYISIKCIVYSLAP